jgi:flagellar biosynthesis chaperone FliJ
MTEEIIIDGVNVAECENLCQFEDGDCCNRQYEKYASCEGYDCAYKQLKRLEQENKELKEEIIELSEEKGHLIVENNTLKESNQSLSMLGTDLASANETVRKEFFRADKNKDMWREKAENYRSALEEIRECVRADCERCTAECDCDDDCTRYKIKNKINEVLK